MKSFGGEKAEQLQIELLSWYDSFARSLSWRAEYNEKPDPYSVWLSEIMLQQTTVATVEPFFKKFILRWPTIEDLAAAEQAEILHSWAGLGYYSRARNLHDCAKVIVTNFAGIFPETEDELIKLPGIGPYTAAAISAIAFNQPAVVVDGNIERIMTRLHGGKTPLRQNKPTIRTWAASLTPTHRPGDYAQALMDLGAAICKPANPACQSCPIKTYCVANNAGLADQLPTKLQKKEKPVRKGIAYVIKDGRDRLLIEKRPPKGLLGGMDGLPTGTWQTEYPAALSDSTKLDVKIKHTFTHFHLELELYQAPEAAAVNFPDSRFVEDLEKLALPTLFAKAIKMISGVRCRR